MSYYDEDGELVTYWQEDFFTEDSAFWGIFALTFIGVVYAIIILFVFDTKNNVEEDLNKKMEERGQFAEQQASKLRYSAYQQQGNFQQPDLGLLQPEHQTQFIKISLNIHDAVMQIFLSQSLYMVFFAIILICLTSYWFMPTVKSALVCILAFCMGIVVGALNAFLCLKFSTCTNPKVIIEANNLEGNPINYAYMIGSLISTLGISVMLLVFSSMLMVSRNKWNDGEDGEDQPLTPRMYQNMAHSLSAFGVGLSFACLFYREVGGQTSKGILVGEEFIGKVSKDVQDQDYGFSSEFTRNLLEKDPKLVIEKNLKMASILSNTITQNLVPLMDSLSVLAALICSSLILFSKSEEFIEEKYYGLYGMFWFFAISTPICFGIAWMAGGKINEDEELAQESAFSIRLQLIIANSAMFLVVLLWPRYCFPRHFQVGDIDSQAWASKQIWHGDIVWCLTIGLFLQTALLIFGEYVTSHAFTPARNTAKDIRKNTSLGLMTAYIFTNNAHFFVLFSIGFCILLSYCIGGFLGIAFTGVGVMCTPVTLLSINFLGGISQDAYRFAELSSLSQQIKDRLFKITWASRNYSVFAQITNMSGLFFANFTAVGAILVIGDIHQINVWQGFTLFGFLMGAGVCYLLKAASVSTCKAVCEELIAEKEDYNEITDESKVQKEKSIDKEDKFQQFVSQKFDIGIMRVGLQILILILGIIIMGLLFGHKCLLGFLLGLNLVGLNMMVQQIFLGNSIKSAKEFNDLKTQNQLSKQEVDNNKNAYFYALAIEQIPGSSLISYLAFCSLFILLGIMAFGKAGYLKSYIEESVAYYPSRSTQWIDSAQHSMESIYAGVNNMAPFGDGEVSYPGPDYDTNYENPSADQLEDGQTREEVVEERQQDVETVNHSSRTPPDITNSESTTDTNTDSENTDNTDQNNDNAGLFLQINKKAQFY